ncbi:hypothetical protein IYW40_04630 [Methylocystis sp. H4A]|uniref:hypothetical protein n=1 Tax=Methylocystis sp. H4A TaxID=2785788 RepID=UPI0018C26C30|nr:hypothetical protein [Methylocystis sp. H4A]MBG0800779.1 hypothetical protein [Methylocystis sp. H4A]
MQRRRERKSPPVGAGGLENVGRREAKNDTVNLALHACDRKPKVFITGELEPRRWARSAARFLSWREILTGFELPEYPPNEICDYPRSPCDPTWRQGLDVNHAVEADRFTFLGPFEPPFGLNEAERTAWREANLQRLESADLLFASLGDFDDDDARRITAELRYAAKFRIPIYAHEDKATAENAIMRATLRSARKRTDGSSMSVGDAFDEALFCWREAQRTRSRSRAAKERRVA